MAFSTKSFQLPPICEVVRSRYVKRLALVEHLVDEVLTVAQRSANGAASTSRLAKTQGPSVSTATGSSPCSDLSTEFVTTPRRVQQ